MLTVSVRTVARPHVPVLDHTRAENNEQQQPEPDNGGRDRHQCLLQPPPPPVLFAARSRFAIRRW